MSDANKMPSLDYQRAPCPHCGAVTVEDAGRLCKPHSDETGERFCDASDHEDAEGYLCQPTAASIAAIDAWCEQQMAAEAAEQG